MPPWTAPREFLPADAGHPLFARCGELLAARLGLRCPAEALAAALAELAPALGCADWPSCLGRLLAVPLTPRQLEILARHLCVGETYFFREPGAFAALRREILPALLSRSCADASPGGPRPLRFWSAGCSTGEEAWSIALTLEQARPEIGPRPVSILATDIDTIALARAAEGIYREWSFRGTAPELKARYFQPAAPGAWSLLPHLRSRVHFARLNLAEDAFPSPANGTADVDVIFCRNVLMYFEPRAAALLIEKLARCLLPGGWLVVSAVEASLVSRDELQPRYLADALLFRKESAP